MSDYYNLLTNLGRSKITDLITSDTALENIQIAFGDGNGSVPTPNPARTALVNEVHRRPANKLQKHPTLTNSIIVDVVIPNNVGGFWIREFGIYFDGTLICNGSLAPTFKEASDDTVNTYRLKPYINVESDRLKVVEIEGNLINATESWTQENFINRSEIVDNLTTNDANKVASARTVKELNDSKLSKLDFDDAYKYMPIPYPKLIPPSGFLVMMGQDIVESIHPKLFALYGPKLPDMRAYMIRGLDNGRGIDVNRVILSEQGDAIREIYGDVLGGLVNNTGQESKHTGAFQYKTRSESKTVGAGWGENHSSIASFKASNIVPTASENRVKNIAFLYIVKAG